MDYLYKIFLLIPLLNFIVIFLKKEEGEIDLEFTFSLSKLFSLIFLAFLIGISTRDSLSTYSLLTFNSHLNLQFNFTSGSILIAYAISIIWIALAFYTQRAHEVQESNQGITAFLKYLPLSIWAINMANFSLNLYTSIVTYSISICLFLTILLQHISTKDLKKLQLYKIFFFFQILILFAVLVIATKYTSLPKIIDGSFPLEQSSQKVSLLILILLLTSLILSFIFPIFYIFRNKIDHENYNILTGFFINFAIAKLLFLKFIAQEFFGIGIFSYIVSGHFTSIIQTTLICSIIASLALLILTKNIKSILFLIIYNQLSLNFLLIFIDFLQDGKSVNSLIFSFILFMPLFFMVLNNFMIYMQKTNCEEFLGSFSSFKINTILAVFCFLSLSSLTPPAMLSSIDMILLTKDLKFNTTMVIIFANALVLLLIGLKIILPSFQDFTKEDKDTFDQEDVKEIDFSSSMTLTPAVIMFIMVVSSFLI